jgi:hypothetical protein
VTLDSNPFTALGATDYIWSTDDGWVNTNSLWVDAGDQAKVGVEGLSIAWFSLRPGVYTDVNYRWAFCDSFDKDFSGYNQDPTSAWSNPITVNGPRTGSSVWAFIYALYVYSNPNPPVPNPAGTGWYPNGSTAGPLNALEYNPGGGRRWILNYWTVDGVSRGPGVNGITVFMDYNHTAIAYYRRQSFVTLEDNIAGFSGITDAGNWYDDGVPYTFTAPTPLPYSPGIRYEFRFWDGQTGYSWSSTDNPVTITFDASWDGERLRARYQTQYRVCVKTNPPGVVVIPPGPCSAWYDAWSIQGPLIAPDPVIIVPGQSRWRFQQWMRSDGWTTPNPNTSTFLMMAPYNYTAYYTLEWYRMWNRSPTTISVTGFPGSDWVMNGTTLNWGAPGTDVSGVFVFYYWVIDGDTYDTATVPILHDHYIVGTAYYANKTKLYMDPDYHNETAHAYCHTFDVTIYASNFDANRLVSSKPMDIYGFDIIIDFPANLIEVQDVQTNLADFFYPNDYFPKPNGKITINNMFGYVQIIATVKGNFTGFSGTKWIFKLTFHVKYDPCYPYHNEGLIRFSYVKLVNHLDEVITPELSSVGCIYEIKTVQPQLEIRNAVTHTNTVKVDKNDPQTFFDVEVYLHNGVKVKDFLVKVDFNKWHINAVSVAIASYLKPPYTNYSWTIDNFHGYVYVGVTQDPSVPLQNCSGLLFTVRFKVVKAIWYKVCGPFTLESDITISYGRLSVICWCGPYDQTTTNTYLRSKSCHYTYNPEPGDLDYDGEVTVLDLQLVLDHYGWWPWYDITGDWKTDIEDLVFVALRFGNPK